MIAFELICWVYNEREHSFLYHMHYVYINCKIIHEKIKSQMFKENLDWQYKIRILTNN